MTKVVNALRYLEQRVNTMIEIWGITPEDALKAAQTAKPTDARPDAHLLNGPAREGEGVAQDDVDRLLNGEIDASALKPPPAAQPAPAPSAPAAPPAADPSADAPVVSSQDDIDQLFQ
jgi:chemotaxis regulatin CheY-phosphate phosphatase CheZ